MKITEKAKLKPKVEGKLSAEAALLTYFDKSNSPAVPELPVPAILQNVPRVFSHPASGELE